MEALLEIPKIFITEQLRTRRLSNEAFVVMCNALGLEEHQVPEHVDVSSLLNITPLKLGEPEGWELQDLLLAYMRSHSSWTKTYAAVLQVKSLFCSLPLISFCSAVPLPEAPYLVPSTEVEASAGDGL